MSEHRWFRPLPEWFVSDRRDWLRADIVAGLTTGAVIIPKAMAYAMIAGLPVQVGLYTALVPMVIYAVLGTSRVLSVSTTTTLAILTAAQLGQVVPSGDPAALLSSLRDLDAAGRHRTRVGLPPAPWVRGELYLRARARWFQSRRRAGHCGRPGPENHWHPLPKRDIRSERPLNRSPSSENVVSNAGRWAHDNRVSAGNETVPAEGPSAAAGC